jgi:hypothetical protein
MNKTIFELTDFKIKELCNKSVKVKNGDVELMDVIRSNYLLWERKLFILCRLSNVSHIEMVGEILLHAGYGDIPKNKLITYLNRAKNERGKK